MRQLHNLPHLSEAALADPELRKAIVDAGASQAGADSAQDQARSMWIRAADLLAARCQWTDLIAPGRRANGYSSTGSQPVYQEIQRLVLEGLRKGGRFDASTEETLRAAIRSDKASLSSSEKAIWDAHKNHLSAYVGMLRNRVMEQQGVAKAQGGRKQASTLRKQPRQAGLERSSLDDFDDEAVLKRAMEIAMGLESITAEERVEIVRALSPVLMKAQRD